VEFRILGPLEVLDGGRPVAIAGSKRRALLVLLLLHANEVVRGDRLIDELWGEDAPRNAHAALHNHVSRLRKDVGGDVLGRREWGYVLRVRPDALDLQAFEQVVVDAEPLPARERSAKLAEALALWRGPPLADLASEPGLQNEIGRLEELRLSTLEHRIDADLEAGRNADLIAEIEALIAAEPLREHLRAQLILALYRAGRQAEALEVYRETRRLLSDELGLEPSPALKELEKAVLRQDPAIAVPASVPAVERMPGRSRFSKRTLLLGLLTVGLLVGGMGAALALTSGRVQHASLNAASATVHTSGPTHATTEPATPTVPTPSTTATTSTRASPVRPRQHLVATRSRHHTTSNPARPPVTRHAVTGTAQPATKAAASPARSTHTRHRTPPPPTQKPRVVTISDDFSGSQIDPTIWYEIDPDTAAVSGTGWTISEQGGHLEFAFPPGTAPGGQYHVYAGHVGTRCQFPGDFDARIDFSLAQWPAANGVFASLWMWFKPNNVGWEAWRASSAQWGEQYGSYTGVGHGGSISLTDPAGSLRVRRRNGVVTAYYLHRGQWISLGSNENTHTAVIAVGAGSGPNPPVRTDQVTVDFDNFTVTATNPICPLGSPGSP
jgi:DNA-binding SARP family transcriptional activator